jgi:hypothetical protein
MTGAMGKDDARQPDRRRALAREWDDLVEQVRELDGFEDFLRPPPLQSLLKAAASGPVVIVNVSRWRCDALIITTKGTHSVALPDLSAADVAERVTAYLAVLRGEKALRRARDVHHAHRGAGRGTSAPGRDDANDNGVAVGRHRGACAG